MDLVFWWGESLEAYWFQVAITNNSLLVGQLLTILMF